MGRKNGQRAKKRKLVAEVVVDEMDNQVNYWDMEVSMIDYLETIDNSGLPTAVFTPESVPLISLDEYEKVKPLGVLATHSTQIERPTICDEGGLCSLRRGRFLGKGSGTDGCRCYEVQTNVTLAYFLYDVMHYSLKDFHTKDEKTLALIAENVLNGLNYLKNEKDFEFRYLTPSNILFYANDGNYKIGDVGSMRDGLILRNASLYINGYRYVAPEHICAADIRKTRDMETKKKNGDIWSLGMCLLEFYLGRFPIEYDPDRAYDTIKLPFFEEDPPQAPPRAPPGSPVLFRNFISRCLVRSPDKRASVNELLSDRFVTFRHESPCFNTRRDNFLSVQS